MKKLIPLLLLISVSRCTCPTTPPCNPSLASGTPGSCPNPSVPAGSFGGRCADWPASPCGANLRCDNGVCISCGGPGQACCDLDNSCAGGLVCDSSPTANWHCANDCGGAGQACCYNNVCQGSLSCNLGNQRCETTTGGACTTGSTTYLVPVVDSSRCALTRPVSQVADSPDQARMCVQSRSSRDQTALAPGSIAQDYTFCQVNEFEQRNTLHVSAYSDADARTCAQYQCLNCTITPGSCN